MITYIAIDPGKLGAIVVSCGTYLQEYKMPDTREGMLKLLREATTGVSVAYIEQVNPFNEGNATAMFHYGQICERPAAILATLNVRTVFVLPGMWQKALGIVNTAERPKRPKMPRGLDGKAKKQWKSDHAEELRLLKKATSAAQTVWKNHLKDTAQAMFPAIKMTLQICDAFLILRYAQQTEGGRLL